MPADDWLIEAKRCFGSGKMGDVLRQRRALMLLGGLGLILVGLLYMFRMFSKEEEGGEVKILSAEERVSGESESGIWVDIEGAVEKPGVYRLEKGARVNEVLIEAGGLSQEADRGWVSRYLNRAAEVEDGVKIYVPKEREVVEEGKGGMVEVGEVGGVKK